ncbi:MAG: cell division protein FtsA [Lactobacillus sp.]|jgi:cell division protein FtsA|uniref:Cell division protein FtsA n=1 Tax=Lacticaseibacillus suilingensis TaxID=2799577 RepID=A0ABW4BFW4_9LACO|nr:cell division protein FtsA [Lacticaseibacillus suilingensis]MCI1894412.1 cell division protein FtsA [Lactobacillus sp.]MCI1916984.1 cell division protein FtsA [Lactobacillus sp.]MCI1941767.1 cell division protein FtsA [Lactobacillus sp.]MCI1972296.1 cell division protein FtsA [Lactobacillus sp.]MCI2016836.1 cell division protein FtsA [Lactobacillus sp.]
MENQDIYVGLDIGTTSIKVIVAELVQGQLNIIGVGSSRSQGLSRGVIVDIDKAAEAIRQAVSQAEEKASIKIQQVVVGVPANMLQIESVTGMIAVGDQSKEITDNDVRAVAAAALVRNLPPEREMLSLTPTEFIVDGFDDIKDPRGMIGVRLEMHGILFTAPKTVLHNTKKAIEKAGLTLRNVVVSPLAQAQVALSDGEADFGTILIDLGGGQSTAAVIHDHKLKFTDVDQEGGEYVTKDISVVLNTGYADAEKLKRDYGTADSLATHEDNTFPVAVVGKTEPIMVSEKYLAEIIEARLTQILTRLNEALQAVDAFALPGGIVITGGNAALPGITELAQDVFQHPVKRYIPDEMGLRHPAFTAALGLITYASQMTDIDLLVASVLPNPPAANERPAAQAPTKVPAKPAEPTSDEPKKASALKRFFGNFFE